jgi:hypothetical protein
VIAAWIAELVSFIANAPYTIVSYGMALDRH